MLTGGASVAALTAIIDITVQVDALAVAVGLAGGATGNMFTQGRFPFVRAVLENALGKDVRGIA